MAQRYAIGVDLGGTKIATGLTDLNGKVIARQIIPTQPELGEVGVVQRINGTIRQVMEDANVSKEEVQGIGICCPGPLNPETGVISFAPNLGWRNVPIVSHIVEEFGIPTYLENDANAAALAEYWFGAGVGAKNLLYITVSTGVGGGVILDGDIYRGRDFMAGEIGHTIVQAENGRLCGCGQHGCLEAIASGTAIGKQAREALAAGRESKMRELVESIEKVDTRVVADAAALGDELALEILQRAVTHLGAFIISMLNVLNVDLVVIGGGVSKLGDVLFSGVRNIVEERMADVPAKRTPIVPAETGDNVGLLGAVGLVARSQS